MTHEVINTVNTEVQPGPAPLFWQTLTKERVTRRCQKMTTSLGNEPFDTSLLEQGSIEWRMARVGHATGSRIADIVKTISNGTKYSTKRGNYLDELVAERLTGQPADWKEVRSLEARKALEPDARACYEFDTGNSVVEVGFVKHPFIPFAGSSPDGLIGKTGGIEIKALDAANHLKLFDGRAIQVVEEYLPQVHFNMACTGRKWWDFVAFNPLMPPAMKLFIQRVPRDVTETARLETAVKDFLAEVDERVARLNGKESRLA
jgi:hypothetical protein